MSLMEGVKTGLSSQVAELFETYIQTIILRNAKCLNSGGGYFLK
jgi:hypothetical protein